MDIRSDKQTVESYVELGQKYHMGLRTAKQAMIVNPQHYRRLALKQTMDAENILLEQDKVIDFPLKPSNLSRYDEVLYDGIYHGQAERKPGSPLDVRLPH